MSTLAQRIGSAELPRQSVIDLAGLPIDVTGDIWCLNSAMKRFELNWKSLPFRSADLRDATREYVAALIRSRSPSSVFNTFEGLKLLRASDAFLQADLQGKVIPASFFAEVGQAVPGARYRLHYLRHWYRFCADRGSPRFSREVAFELETKTIGGNDKGHAVLSVDPEKGPLNDLEITALLAAMNDARRRNSVPLDEMALLWLFIALGCNAFQIALLREDDFEIVETNEGRLFQMRVPRVKKRAERPRMEFRIRGLTDEIGDVVLRLVEQNRRRRELDGWPDPRHAFPLFVRETPRSDDPDDPMVEYARHLYSQEITRLVVTAVSRLGVVSSRTGEALRLTSRRLRYTFATRLVREGASQQEIADSLDHSDLQSVPVYFDVKSDIVESLDRAMAIALGPVAQAFLGKLVRNESEAERGDDPRSRVSSRETSTGAVQALGTCGEHSFCTLFSPIACYTCASFQPWMDGPHDRILDDLLALRERRVAAGQDGRMASLHDATILAIGHVISCIDEARVQAQS